MKLDLLAVLPGERGDFSAARVVPAVGPLPPVLAQAAGTGLAQQCFKAAVLLQGIACLGAVALEIDAQWMVAFDEVVKQQLQQSVAHVPGLGPVDQRLLLELLKGLLEPQGLDGHPHHAFTQYHGRVGVQAVEEQAAGGRVRAVALCVAGEHGVQRADGQGIGAAFGGAAGQLLQGLAIAVAAITVTAQAVELRADAPAARGWRVQRIAEAEAAGGGHGEGKAPLIDVHPVVADRQPRRQAGVRVQLQVVFAAVLMLHPDGAGSGEVGRQVQCLLFIDGEQWRQVPGVVGCLQGGDAGGDGLRVVGRVTQPCQHLAQGAITDLLGAPVGVDPVHRKPGQLGQLLQVCVSHGQAPAWGWAAG
ncbi:hypothetical protein D3C77_278650 [compost metagenome]